MSLIYAPVSSQHPLVTAQINDQEADLSVMIGFSPARGGNDHLYVAHRPLAIHVEEKTLRFHFGESDSC